LTALHGAVNPLAKLNRDSLAASESALGEATKVGSRYQSNPLVNQLSYSRGLHDVLVAIAAVTGAARPVFEAEDNVVSVSRALEEARLRHESRRKLTKEKFASKREFLSATREERLGAVKIADLERRKAEKQDEELFFSKESGRLKRFIAFVNE